MGVVWRSWEVMCFKAIGRQLSQHSIRHTYKEGIGLLSIFQTYQSVAFTYLGGAFSPLLFSKSHYRCQYHKHHHRHHHSHNLIMIPIIFEVAQRPVGAPLVDIFRCTDCPSVILHFPSYITARTIVIHLDNNVL